MKKMNIFYIITVLSAFFAGNAFAQTKTSGGRTSIDSVVEFDRIVYDFGDVQLSDGPLSCSFTVTNISKKPMAIYNVVSSCGCTNVKWTREPLKPGTSGKISATYTNDEGAYPFDKTLTVYLSNVKKPVILRIRGVTHDKEVSLEELFPVRFGNLALKDADFKLGNMNQGSQRGDEVEVANLGSSPLKIDFENISPGLKISLSPNPVPARSKARITYIITSDREHWGKNYYEASPVVNGKKEVAGIEGKSVKALRFMAFIKEDFSGYSEKDLKKAAQPVMLKTAVSFGIVKSGTLIDAKYTMTNKGKETLKIYKIDSDSPGVRYSAIPEIPGGETKSFHIYFPTKNLNAGDITEVIVLTTNSPVRPIVNLYLSGAIEK